MEPTDSPAISSLRQLLDELKAHQHQIANLSANLHRKKWSEVIAWYNSFCQRMQTTISNLDAQLEYTAPLPVLPLATAENAPLLLQTAPGSDVREEVKAAEGPLHFGGLDSTGQYSGEEVELWNSMCDFLLDHAQRQFQAGADGVEDAGADVDGGSR